jgi:hypothetical protein
MNPWIYLILFVISVIIFIAANEIAINLHVDKEEHGFLNIVLSFLAYGSLALAIITIAYAAKAAECACDRRFK